MHSPEGDTGSPIAARASAADTPVGRFPGRDQSPEGSAGRVDYDASTLTAGGATCGSICFAASRSG
jgi:hypothetical protein